MKKLRDRTHALKPMSEKSCFRRFSEQPRCSPWLRGDKSPKTINHGGTENTEDSQKDERIL